MYSNKDFERELKIEFAEEAQMEIQGKTLEDTYVGNGLQFGKNQRAAQAMLQWFRTVDIPALDDQTLHLTALAIDSINNDGTFIHSIAAFNSAIDMTRSEADNFSNLKFWDSSPFGNDKGLAGKVAATPQRLAMLSHDKNAVEFLNTIYEPLAIAGRQNDHGK